MRLDANLAAVREQLSLCDKLQAQVTFIRPVSGWNLRQQGVRLESKIHKIVHRS
jgi:hypothetical protein